MSSIGTGYDQSTTTFSPDGRVFQVEYATKAVDNSSTAVGIRCKDGVVMAVEKPKLSKMIVEGSNRRIMSVDKHSGICASGMIADARQIVNHGRSEAARYRDFYGGSIPGQTLCDRIAGLMHTYTLYWYAHYYCVPLGFAVLSLSLCHSFPLSNLASLSHSCPTPLLYTLQGRAPLWLQRPHCLLHRGRPAAALGRPVGRVVTLLCACDRQGEERRQVAAREARPLHPHLPRGRRRGC